MAPASYLLLSAAVLAMAASADNMRRCRPRVYVPLNWLAARAQYSHLIEMWKGADPESGRMFYCAAFFCHFVTRLWNSGLSRYGAKANVVAANCAQAVSRATARSRYDRPASS